MRGSATAAAVLAVGVLVIVVYSIAVQGGSQLSFGFLTKAPPLVGLPGGGIAPRDRRHVPDRRAGDRLRAADRRADRHLPHRVLLAAHRLSNPAGARPAQRTALDRDRRVRLRAARRTAAPQVGWAGSFALAIIMIPLIARATLEILRLVPQAQRDASHALGISRWRTTLGIVLPACLSGILTGTVLAVARAAGETAPLLFFSSIYNPNQGTTLNIFGAPRSRTSRSRSSPSRSRRHRPITRAPGAPRSC